MPPILSRHLSSRNLRTTFGARAAAILAWVLNAWVAGHSACASTFCAVSASCRSDATRNVTGIRAMQKSVHPEHQTERHERDNRCAADESSSASDPQEAGAGSPHLDEGHQEQAADHSAPHALVLNEIVRDEGEAALSRPPGALAWSSLAAGMSMGFSFLIPAVLDARLPDAPWRPLVSSFGYTVGFVLVIMGRQQLFAESMLTVVLPVLTSRDATTALKALRLWAVVLLFNMLGTWIFAAMLRFPGIFTADVIEAAQYFRGRADVGEADAHGRPCDSGRLADCVNGLASAQCAVRPLADRAADYAHGGGSRICRTSLPVPGRSLCVACGHRVDRRLLHQISVAYFCRQPDWRHLARCASQPRANRAGDEREPLAARCPSRL